MPETVAFNRFEGLEDAALIRAVALRDAAAFQELIVRYGRALHRLAWHMLSDASEAEDVVQDTFVRLWDRASDWQPKGGGAPAWLRRIATNLCLDRLRKRQRVSCMPPPDRPDEDRRADTLVDQDRMAAIVRGALATLPDRQRAAVVLTYYEELGNAAAAATLEMNVKAFESLLQRARAALRAQIAEAGISAEDLGECA